jgi:hypothetical protein
MLCPTEAIIVEKMSAKSSAMIIMMRYSERSDPTAQSDYDLAIAHVDHDQGLVAH